MKKLIDKAISRYPKLSSLFEIYKFASERIEQAQLKQVASSLTLTTILSLVPAVAVILAAFTAFPLFEQYREGFEQLVLKSMLPAQYSGQILEYIKNFASQATNLTIFGLLGLVVTALLCIYNIDTALNNTFHVVKFRSIWQRFLIYWAFLTLGPIVIVLSLTASTYVTSLAFTGKLTILTKYSVQIGQFFFQGLLLTVMYYFVPNCRVLWRDAIAGGFLMSAVLTFFRWAFGVYVLRGSYGTIYGAFAVIPILLTWTYIMWMLLLAGAAITATLPVYRAKRFMDFSKTGNDFLSAVALLDILYNAKTEGSPSVSDIELAKMIGSYPEAVSRILTRLEKDKLVVGVQNGNGRDWVLVADGNKETLRSTFEEFCIDPNNSILEMVDAEKNWISEGFKSEWLNRSLADVFNSEKLWKQSWKEAPVAPPPHLV